jgi:putative transposase
MGFGFPDFYPIKRRKSLVCLILLDAERKEVQQTQESVGIDLGIKAFATMSKNQVFDALKLLKQAKTKLAIQGQASKQVKGSKN